MISAGLLALIVSASVSALKPTGLIKTATEGVLGNQADAIFFLVCQRLVKTLSQKESVPIREDLRRLLWLSYLRALISISSVCKAELVGNFPKTYRGQPVYDEAVKSDIRWLDGHLEQLSQKIEAAKGKQAVLPDITLEELKGFATAGAKPSSSVALASQQQIELAIPTEAIPLYIEKLKQPKEGVLDKTFDFFIEQLDQGSNSRLHTFFKAQLLVQIHNSLAEQKITLQDIENNLKQVSQEVLQVPEQFEQVLDKLETIKTDERPDLILGMMRDVHALAVGTQKGSVEQTESVSFAINDENPYVPVNGRIDSPDQFFGQEQTLRRIFETLNSGSSVALIGDREMGKSSLLKAVEASAKDFLTVFREPIYFDLRHVENEDDFYYALCDKAGIPECKGYRLKRALASKRLLLLLDEIEKMTWDGFTNHVRGQLRGLAEGSEAPLRLVVAASQSLDRLFPDGAEANMVSPLSGICQEETVSIWNEDIIRDFVADRLQTTSIQFDEADLIRIVKNSRGRPRDVVMLCNQHYASLQRQPL
ncbi:MAG: hypothetical protein ACFB16_26200 [Phormidesmis sp.]